METKQTTSPAAQENIMGTMSINPLLIKLSVPMMVSMLVQALYNVVDSIFVSHVSESALTAVSLAFSLQNVMIAVGVGDVYKRQSRSASAPVSASTRCCPRASAKRTSTAPTRPPKTASSSPFAALRYFLSLA